MSLEEQFRRINERLDKLEAAGRDQPSGGGERQFKPKVDKVVCDKALSAIERMLQGSGLDGGIREFLIDIQSKGGKWGLTQGQVDAVMKCAARNQPAAARHSEASYAEPDYDDSSAEDESF